MLILFVGLIILTLQQNTLVMPDNNVTINKPNFDFIYYITDTNSIRIQINFKSYNFFGLSYSASMHNVI
jgi:hypothetical protein